MVDVDSLRESYTDFAHAFIKFQLNWIPSRVSADIKKLIKHWLYNLGCAPASFYFSIFSHKPTACHLVLKLCNSYILLKSNSKYTKHFA